jgi:hypothetical protein
VAGRAAGAEWLGRQEIEKAKEGVHRARRYGASR